MTSCHERPWSLYCEQVWPGSDRFGQVRTLWNTIFCQPWGARSPNLAHPQTCVQFPNRTSLETLRPSKVVDSGLCHASVGIRCELVWSATSPCRNSTSRTTLENYPSRTLKYAVSAGLPEKIKKITAFNFWVEKEKFRPTKHYDAPLEGSTIFLYRSSTCHTSMESCRLAELKYAFFSRTGRKTKKLRCSKLFLSTVSKHGLLEGYTFLFQYSSITRTPLESSRLGELKYAISAG